MSYRLIDANDLNGKISEEDYKVVLNAPCIYADLPKGLDGRYYGLTKREKKQEWIPVDKGLPPKDTTVWVTTIHNVVYLGEVWLYEGGKFSWYINDDNHSPSYVKAWKPCDLPEPYKAESEDKE